MCLDSFPLFLLPKADDIEELNSSAIPTPHRISLVLSPEAEEKGKFYLVMGTVDHTSEFPSGPLCPK